MDKPKAKLTSFISHLYKFLRTAKISKVLNKKLFFKLLQKALKTSLNVNHFYVRKNGFIDFLNNIRLQHM